MQHTARVVAGLVLLFAVTALPATARAQTPPLGCSADTLPDGAHWFSCVPPGWNGQLVVFAPGYRVPQLPKDFYQYDLTTPPLHLLVQSLGYAFATTSYRKTGLVIVDGVDDVRQLVAAFRVAYPETTKVHLTGVSEGGLVATLLAERSPELFSSTLAACGPIGSFRQQVNYLGDFRALFDYYYPGLLPGSPVSMPEPTDPLGRAAWLGAWVSVHVPAIANALDGNQAKAFELMRVARVAHAPGDLAAAILSATTILAYNVLGLNDAKDTLGGNPYGNRFRWYFGSSNDLRLNLLVRRYTAEPAALAAMAPYETNGDLRIPLVTLHTTADEIAPFAHELLYLPKVDRTDRGAFLPIPIARYGHCNFTAQEVALSFLFTANLP